MNPKIILVLALTTMCIWIFAPAGERIAYAYMVMLALGMSALIIFIDAPLFVRLWVAMIGGIGGIWLYFECVGAKPGWIGMVVAYFFLFLVAPLTALFCKLLTRYPLASQASEERVQLFHL